LHPASHKDIPARRIYYLGSSLTHEAWFSTQLTCPFIWTSCGIAERAACLSPFHPARILCDLKNMATTTHNMRSCSICHQYSTPYPANHLSVRMARSACVPAVRTRRADAPEPPTGRPMASHSKSGHAARRDPETNRRETLQPADGYGAPVPAGRLSVVLQTSAFCSLRWGPTWRQLASSTAVAAVDTGGKTSVVISRWRLEYPEPLPNNGSRIWIWTMGQ
jgi:hypothetical protein